MLGCSRRGFIPSGIYWDARPCLLELGNSCFTLVPSPVPWDIHPLRGNTAHQEREHESWFLQEVLFHRNLKLTRLEKPSQVTESNHSLSTAKATPNHVPRCHIHAALNPSGDGDSTPALGCHFHAGGMSEVTFWATFSQVPARGSLLGDWEVDRGI